MGEFHIENRERRHTEKMNHVTGDPVIRFTNVSFRHAAVILHDVSWTVTTGQHWVIIGNNGSGKTTLLNLVNGYLWPSHGDIEVLGKRFGDVDLRDLRKQIGWVSAAFGERVYSSHPVDAAIDVVASGKFASIGLYDTPTAVDVTRAGELLAEFGAADLASRRYHTLSQGEKQRVLLARAWMAAPKLLILDEPCTGLDLLAREQLLSAVERLAGTDGGPTLLYVTHHPDEVLPVFTHALLVKDGTVQSAGEKDQVLSSANLSATFGVPVDVTWHDDRPWVKVTNTSSGRQSSP